MKILIWLVISNFGIWISSFAQTNEGGQRAEDIGNELERILSQDECLFFKNRLINILRTLGANIQLDANQMSMRFEEEMKKMVSMGELSRSCHRKILDELKERKLTAISPEAKPVTASAPAATALGPPGQAKAANETKEPDSPQTAKPESTPASLDKNPTAPKSPVTGKVTDDIKKGANIKVPADSGKVADGLKKGAKSITPNRPVTGPLTNAKRVTGTGNTTGHIADLTIDNPGSNVMEIEIPNMFIPSINDL